MFSAHHPANLLKPMQAALLDEAELLLDF